MSTTARAAIFERANAPFRMATIPLPAFIAAGELLVEITLATICGSDLHTFTGRRAEPVPCVLGHEGVGRVIAAGAGREAWLGRRVTWSSADSCGQCIACTAWALPQKCLQLFKYGHASVHDGSGLNGTYASHILLRAGTHLVELPDAVSDAAAVSANCSLATSVHLVEQLPPRCQVAVVQGAGMLGLHLCALLRSAGVERVLVVDSDNARRERAREFGGEPCDSADIEARVADVVIDVAGAPSLVPGGIRQLRPGGHYLLAGMVHPDSALGLTGEALIRGCITMRGVHNYAPRHLDRAVAFLRDSTLPWASLVSPPLPLERLDDGFALASTRRWARVALSPAHLSIA
jgi:putative phosphonate catabolism associated alcohol dehydrogenase